MGVVVSARHLALDERVAIKFLLPEVAESNEAVQRFLREAQAAVKIRSEHVARVSDVGTMHGGAPYIVMEFLAGSDLAEHLEKRGALPIEEAVDHVLQACEALAEAHAIGIVHRDIKPANLFVTTRNDGSSCLKVLDFGISKFTGNDRHDLTRTQGMIGSPLYMSPEQLTTPRDVDARADVYALGVVLYELLTARQPYEADELPHLIVKILTEPPAPLHAHRAGVPLGLQAAIARCLAKDRASRTPGVDTLAAEIAPFGSGRARLSAERTARIADARRSSSQPPPLVTSRPSQPGGTLMTVGETRPPPPPRTSPLLLAMSLALIAVVGAALLFASRHFLDVSIAQSLPPLAARDASAAPREEPSASSHVKPATSTAATPIASSSAGADASTSASAPIAIAIAPHPSASVTSKPATLKPRKPIAPAASASTKAPPSATEDPFEKHVF